MLRRIIICFIRINHLLQLGFDETFFVSIGVVGSSCKPDFPTAVHIYVTNEISNFVRSSNKFSLFKASKHRTKIEIALLLEVCHEVETMNKG